jgi:hypothetical protein
MIRTCRPAGTCPYIGKAGQGQKAELPLQYGGGYRGRVISHIQADFADGRDSQYLTYIGLQVQNPFSVNTNLK